MLTAIRRSPLTITLVALNLLIFGYQEMLSAEQRDLFVLRWSAVPVEIVEGNDLEPRAPFPVAGTLLSSLFLHADALHLATNMALLALFGARVEPAMGWLRMLGLYLAGGLAGALAQVAASPSSLVELVGASGAIAALMGATLVIRPRPALHMLVLVAWSAIQAAALADQLVGPRTLGGGLAIWSHLAGLAVGLALALPVGRAPPAHP